MKTDEVLLSEGSYAKNQFYCKSRVIAWSHTRRFQMARKLVESRRGGKLLDYGCGDGSFLVLARDLFVQSVGVDQSPDYIRGCRERLSQLEGLRFALLDEFEFGDVYDVVTCMEVLEHCTEPQVEKVLNDLKRLMAPNGILIISVPIEIGPSLLIKELFRFLAGLRNLGHYRWKEKYSLKELFKMTFANENTAIERPHLRADFSPDRPNVYHGHKGFNWLSLKKELKKNFQMECIQFSPLGFAQGLLSSQAWFILKKRS